MFQNQNWALVAGGIDQIIVGAQYQIATSDLLKLDSSQTCYFWPNHIRTTKPNVYDDFIIVFLLAILVHGLVNQIHGQLLLNSL